MGGGDDADGGAEEFGVPDEGGADHRGREGEHESAGLVIDGDGARAEPLGALDELSELLAWGSGCWAS